MCTITEIKWRGNEKESGVSAKIRRDKTINYWGKTVHKIE